MRGGSSAEPRHKSFPTNEIRDNKTLFIRSKTHFHVNFIMPPKLGQVVETILYTSDAQKLAEWYISIFGLTPFLSAPFVVGFSLPNNTILLLFSRSSTTADKVSESGTIPKHGCETGLGQHIAFACDGVAELEEWETWFEEKGVEILGRMEWERGGKSVYVRDWEGHVIEVMTRGVWEVY